MNVNQRLDAIEAWLVRAADIAAPDSPMDAEIVLARTFKKGATYPTAAKRVYAVRQEDFFDVAETENGGYGVTTNAGGADREFYAINLGASIPPQGEIVLCILVGGYWVFRHDKAAT